VLRLSLAQSLLEELPAQVLSYYQVNTATPVAPLISLSTFLSRQSKHIAPTAEIFASNKLSGSSSLAGAKAATSTDPNSDDDDGPQLSLGDQPSPQPSSRYFNTSGAYTSDAFFNKPKSPEPLTTQVVGVVGVPSPPRPLPTIQVLTLDDVALSNTRSGSSLVTDAPTTFSSTACYPEDDTPRLSDQNIKQELGAVMV
jgi:hypothetical protein